MAALTLAKAQRALQLARGIHRADARAVALLRRRWPDIQEVGKVDGHTITIDDPDALQTTIADAIRNGSTRRDDADAGHRDPPPPAHHRRKQVGAWLGLWTPHMRRRWLAGVVPSHADADDNASAPPDTATPLARYWRDTFRPAATNRRLGRALARTFVHDDPNDEWPLPTASTIGRALRRPKATAPGPDGIHYDGWKAAGPKAWAAVSSLGIHIAGGHAAPPSWGESRTVFLPKGDSPTDRPELSERWRPPGTPAPSP